MRLDVPLRNESLTVKGHCHEIFCFWFFSWTSFPQPRIILLGPFQIFSQKFAAIFTSQGAPPVPMTPATKLKQVSTAQEANLPPVSTTPAANFATSFASVVDTGGKFATGVNNAGTNLPSVSTTLGAICHRYQWHQLQIWHRCQWHGWQIMGKISGCWDLKVSLKEKWLSMS